MKAIPTLPIFIFLFFFFYANAQDIKILDQSVTGMVYVEQLDRIFIVVGSDSGPNSNSICMVDPYFGKIERSFFYRKG
jgi:hypothetical protein